MYTPIFIYYGFLAMLVELVLFRELAVLFYGSELFFGIFLSSWLFWVGLGSLLAKRLLKKGRPADVYFSYAFSTAALLFPALILIIRASKNAFSFGEFIGPIGMTLYTFGVMSLLCLVTGAQFSLACAAAPEEIRKVSAIGRVYLCETLGAVIGGALFTYALVGFVPMFSIAIALSLGSVLSGVWLLFKKISIKSILSIAAILVILLAGVKLEPVVNRIEWGRYQFVSQKEARNDTFSLVSMGSIKNVFVDGMLSASFPNPEGYEAQAHWPLLASPEPSRILVIGQTSLGVLKEALKHNPVHIDYVVNDSSFLDLARAYLGSEWLSVLNDQRISIHYGDARIFVRNCNSEYDVVIVDYQDVPNLKANRFFTEEFYRQAKSILASGGILSLGVASSENYLSMKARMFNSSVYRTLKAIFNTVEAIPGDTVMFLSSASGIDMSNGAILGRFIERRLSNQYVIPSYIEHKLESPRRAELTSLLENTPGVKINRDFNPTTCYYFAGFWFTKFASGFGYLVCLIVFMITAFVLVKKRGLSFSPAMVKEPILMSVLGFVGISLELILLSSYQIISGYVYWQMGVLFASFMSGLFLGSLLCNQLKHSSRRKCHTALIILSLVIVGLSAAAAIIMPRLILLSVMHNIVIFTSLLAMIGASVGGAFVTAGFLISPDEVAAKAGRLYAFDLWGSALGAMLSTNLIVPVFGIVGAFNISAAVGLAGLCVFLVLSRKAAA